VRRTLSILVAVVATFAIAGTALAANPHTVGSAKTTVSGNSLIISQSVAGLGNVPEVTLSLQGTLDVFAQCYNRGGKNPAADNKQEQADINLTGTFPVRNGRTNATFTITPASTLECPGNQRVVIESATGTLNVVYQGDTIGQIAVNYTR